MAVNVWSQGDSGGPLVCKDQYNYWTVVGINSFVVHNCTTQGVVARVSSYTNWILLTIIS